MESFCHGLHFTLLQGLFSLYGLLKFSSQIVVKMIILCFLFHGFYVCLLTSQSRWQNRKRIKRQTRNIKTAPVNNIETLLNKWFCVLLPLIILVNLENRKLLHWVQKIMPGCDWWIPIHFVCFFSSRFVCCTVVVIEKKTWLRFELQGQVVQKLVSANPGLNVYWSINFSLYKNVFYLCFV